MDLDAMVDFNDEKDQKPIHLAAQNDHTAVVKLFLENRPSLVSATTRTKGCTQIFSRQIFEYIFYIM